jgi:hypothetical protein
VPPAVARGAPWQFPYFDSGPQGQDRPAQAVGPAGSQPKCIVPHPNFYSVCFEYFQIEFKPLEICHNSNEFDKNMKSILLFELKYNL